MASSLQQRFLINLQEGMNEGRNVMVKVALRVTGKVPIKEQFDALSNTKTKRFNADQKSHIQSNMPIHKMDISLLDLVIKIFGNIGPCPLADLLNDLKQERNDFVHEGHTMLLSKDILKSKLAKLKSIYTSILEELKNFCPPEEYGIIDSDIAFTQAQLLLLEKTLDDEIQEKTEELVTATVNAAYQMAQLPERAKVQQNELIAKLNTHQEQMITKLKEEMKAQQEQMISEMKEKTTAQQEQMISEMKEKTTAQLEQITEHTKVREGKLMDALHKGVEESLKRINERIEEMNTVQQERTNEDGDHITEQSRATTAIMRREDGQVTEPIASQWDIRAAAGWTQDQGLNFNCNVTYKYQNFAGATIHNVE